MPVYELRERMSHQEYVEWQMYYGRKAQQQQLAELKAAGKG